MGTRRATAMEFRNVLYLLMWAVVFFLIMRFGCGAHVTGHGRQHAGNRPGPGPDARWAPPAKAEDPVCGMTVDTANAKSAVDEGHVYFFCSQNCRDKFERNPAAYARPSDTSSHSQETHHGSC